MKSLWMMVISCFLLQWELYAAYGYKEDGGQAGAYVNKTGNAPNEGTVRDNGYVVDRYGRQRGKIEGDKFYKRLGAVVSPDQEIIVDSNGKNWPMSVDKKGNLCYDPVRSPNYNNIPYGFDVPICATGTEDAMVQVAQMLDNACRNEKEESMVLVKRGEAYVLRRIDRGDGDAESVSGEVSILKGEEVVAVLHNHPEVNGQDSLWPSETDAISALKNGCDSYIRDCATGRIGVFDYKDGQVYEIKDGKRELLVRNFGDYIRRDDGRDPYEYRNLASLRKKSAQRKGPSTGTVENAQLDLSEQKLVDGMKEKIGVRGWCRCGGKKDKGCCCGYGAILGASATDCPYVYTLCKRCGKCVRDPDNLIDVKVEVALQKAKNMTTSQFLAERKKAQARLLAIPDGQIVIPGKCVCEKPDVIKAGSLDGKEFYVCLLCGRCYVPVNNTVPIGPTARKELGLK